MDDSIRRPKTNPFTKVVKDQEDGVIKKAITKAKEEQDENMAKASRDVEKVKAEATAKINKAINDKIGETEPILTKAAIESGDVKETDDPHEAAEKYEEEASKQADTPSDSKENPLKETVAKEKKPISDKIDDRVPEKSDPLDKAEKEEEEASR